MNITLPADPADFVEAEVQTGDFTSSSAVVQQALRPMERVEQQNAGRLADLRDAWQDGLGSGAAVALGLEALEAEARALCKIQPEGVQIVRVIHGARDPGERSWTPEPGL